MRSKFAIVVIGYNRLRSIQRLCDSLKKADYLNDKIDLIISLDFCDDKSVLNFSENIQWKNGNKYVVFHEEKMGLRKHILSCGAFLDQYEALAVFEDDVFVSPAFYSYMKQAVAFYQDCDDIGGISFYCFERNGNNGLGFKPAPSKYDNFFMQVAQSWGQIWLRRQWKEFYQWYLENQELQFESIHIPEAIKRWGNSSWLKYHTVYCHLKQKYFVYPYKSLTTCFAEAGEHAKFSDNIGQVTLYSENQNYIFARCEDDAVKYDIFYERMDMERYLNSKEGNKRICIDLYGDKYCYDNATHLLTTKQLESVVPEQSFALRLKPHEMNVICQMEGDDIYLYNICGIAFEDKRIKKCMWKKWEYFAAPKMTSDFNMMLLYLKKLIRKHFVR